MSVTEYALTDAAEHIWLYARVANKKGTVANHDSFAGRAGGI